MILFFLGIVSVCFLGFAHYWGLFIAPPDRMMGDVYRILFVHVPAAWMALLFCFLNFLGSILYLLQKTQVWQRRRVWDRFAHASAEIAVVMTGLAVALGSIWGRPTWGVWWTWDPRLTTTALLFILYMGTLILRRLLEDPERRAKVVASLGVLLFINVPIVYLSVKWWRSLHQMQSSPETMAPSMVIALRMNAVALLGVCLFLLWVRLRLAKKEERLEEGGES